MKPDLPKRLAARVRAAISKISSARLNIASSEFRIKQDIQRVNEFEADPELFARTYYRGCTVDSHPVQTNIARIRESIEYRTACLPTKEQLLKHVESSLAQIEKEVLEEVLAMRPTSGRVPWPAPPRSLDGERIKLHKHMAAADALFEKDQQERIREGMEEVKEWERLQHSEDAENSREWQAELAAMTPEQRAKEQKGAAMLKTAFASGVVTPQQILVELMERSRNQN